MSEKDIDLVRKIVHETILSFMDEESEIMTKEDILLLEVNKAICEKIKQLNMRIE